MFTFRIRFISRTDYHDCFKTIRATNENRNIGIVYVCAVLNYKNMGFELIEDAVIHLWLHQNTMQTEWARVGKRCGWDRQTTSDATYMHAFYQWTERWERLTVCWQKQRNCFIVTQTFSTSAAIKRIFSLRSHFNVGFSVFCLSLVFSFCFVGALRIRECRVKLSPHSIQAFGFHYTISSFYPHKSNEFLRFF